MVKKSLTVNFTDDTEKMDFNIPDKCPHCGGTMNPSVYMVRSIHKLRDINAYVGVFCRCTYDNCSKYYSLGFNTVYEPKKFNHRRPTLDTYNYRPPIKVTLPEGVEVVSPQFFEIYSQATVAESEGLDQIAGVGYRKSLEFLVKDYAIRYFPNETDKIKKMLLGPVIKEYLAEFKKLQNLATAASWIGNDETHYVRRHDNQDIQSMKRFIRAAAQYIAAEFDAEDADEFTSS